MIDLCPPHQTLLPFQIQGVETMIRRKHNLLADEPGLGKTISSAALINALRLKKVLIIGNASIKIHWMRKLKEWLVEKHVIQIIEGRQDFIMHELANTVIINYDLITSSYIFHQLKAQWWDLLICDEAHKLKSMDSQRSQAVLARNGLVHNSARTLMLTGTPVQNRPIELFPLLRVLCPAAIKPYDNYYKYVMRFCDGYQDGFGLKATGSSNENDLNKRLREHYMIRRTYNEVQTQLPKIRFEFLFVGKTKNSQSTLKVIENAVRQDFSYIDTGGIGEIATARRQTAEAKVNAAIDIIKKEIDQSGKLVIFGYHHSVINKVLGGLKDYAPAVLTGSSSTKERQRAIDTFRNDNSCRVFIGNLQAAGEGIDGLQYNCHRILFVETSWVPAEIEQAIKRIHRIGQDLPVLVKFLVFSDSIEEHMLRVALEKVRNIREILK